MTTAITYSAMMNMVRGLSRRAPSFAPVRGATEAEVLCLVAINQRLRVSGTALPLGSGNSSPEADVMTWQGFRRLSRSAVPPLLSRPHDAAHPR
jgi:hypothetical protein